MAESKTVRTILAESYSNLAMAHMALSNGDKAYSRNHYMVRARLKKGLMTGKMSMRPLAEDEKLKMIIPRTCCYCGKEGKLTSDHLIPTSRGGPNVGDNLVWACRSCNSSKGARDMLGWWFSTHQEFPPVLLVRRYLKNAWQLAASEKLLDQTAEEFADNTGRPPFEVQAIPQFYPPPQELRLWIVPIV